MNKFLATIILLINIIISIQLLEAGTPPLINGANGIAKNPSIPSDKNIAYIIDIPGKPDLNGKSGPARIYKVPRLKWGQYMPNSVYVKAKNVSSIAPDGKGFHSAILQSTAKNYNIESVRAPFERFFEGNPEKIDVEGVSRIYEIHYSAPVDPYDVCIEMMKNPEVEYAVPIFQRYIHEFVPNDPRFNQQWHHNNIDSKLAWDMQKGSKSVLIAIVDNAIDYAHEDLAANYWTNPGEIPNDGIDNDKNGFIDDWRGWDFVGDISSDDAYNERWKEDNDPKPKNNYVNHGTHCAGCAAAVGNNGLGVAGVAINCSIVGIKCGSDQSTSSIFRGYDGILYAAKLGADVISCSWGGAGSSPVEQDIINQATAMGSVVCVSAGNSAENVDDGTVYPAGYKNVLCVGATGSNDKSASFSCYGRMVTVFAPGVSIMSTLPGNIYGNMSGTSMSCPVVAGIAGLVRSMHPNWEAGRVIRQIRLSSDDVVANNASQRSYYYGRANAQKALSYNSSLTQGNRTPGIAVSGFQFESSDALTGYEPQVIHIEVTNYLAVANDLVVKIEPFFKYMKVAPAEVNLGTLGTLKSTTFDITVTLDTLNPWFYGEVSILFSYECSGYVGRNYEDFELFNLPIRIETENKFEQVDDFPWYLYPIWYSTCALSDSSYFMAGGSQLFGLGVLYTHDGKAGDLNFVSVEPITSMSVVDDSLIYAVTEPFAEKPMFYKTTNRGNNWTSAYIDNISKYLDAIYMFNAKEGIIIGDPQYNVWGLGSTVDSGKTWKNISGVPLPLSNEISYVGASHRFENSIWFGTSAGRAIYSHDQGKSWRSSKISDGLVLRFAFADADNGVALYTNENSTSSIRRIASTSDGGASWTTGLYNFNSLGVFPLDLFNLPGTRQFIVLCQNGEVYATQDFGRNWTPVLTYEWDPVTIGGFYGGEGKATLWSGYTSLYRLDFSYENKTIKKELALLSGDTLNFDTVSIGSKKPGSISFRNTGNANIKIQNVEIIPEGDVSTDEYSISQNLTDEIQPDDLAYMTIDFSPGKEGLRSAKVKVTCDAEQSELSIYLRGVGVEPVSVEQCVTGLSVSDVIPNPCINEGNFFITLDSPAFILIEVTNTLGEKIFEVFNGRKSAGTHEYKIDCSKLSSGAYYMKCYLDENVIIRKFVSEK